LGKEIHSDSPVGKLESMTKLRGILSLGRFQEGAFPGRVVEIALDPPMVGVKTSSPLS